MSARPETAENRAIGADAVRRARVDLAAALRWAARLGLHEGVCNHFSLAVPGRDDRFLLNPEGLHWSEVTASDLIVVDVGGTRVEGRHEAEPTAFFIHSRIHRARADARCVLHTHMPYATALTCTAGGRLAWASQNALRFHGRVAYDGTYNGVALDAAEGDRMAAAFADADILFLANHGVIVAGPDVARAFDDLYYLERAAMHQVLAESTGRPLKIVPDEVCRRTARQIAAERRQTNLHFAALKRILAAEAPDYAR